MNTNSKFYLKSYLLLFLLLCFTAVKAQIYRHEFTTTSGVYPYAIPPTTYNPNTNTWAIANSSGSWTNTTAASGNGLRFTTPVGSSSITLTFNIATGYVGTIDKYEFWSRKSGSGPPDWRLKINGTSVDTGTTTNAGGSTGIVPITPVTGLTGTVTVTLELSNAGGGNYTIDNFGLYGNIVSNCTGATINSYQPATGPVGTQLTFTGNGFTNVNSVTISGVTATYNIVSDNTLTAIVPAGTTTGNIIVRAGTCSTAVTNTFTTLTSGCGNPDIYISEVYDASSGNGDYGAIEIYNPTSSRITFAGRYVLERYGDYDDAAPTTGNYSLTLPGYIEPNATFLIRCGNQPVTCNSLTYSVPTGSFDGINGNDGFKIRKDGIVRDFVRAPVSPGYTLIRRPGAIAPAATYSAADWSISSNEVCTDLGRHTADPSPGGSPTVTNPQSAVVCEGGNVTFTSGATGTGYTFQWKTLNAAGNWVNVTNNTTFSGATTATLSIANATATLDKTQYYCFITSSTCTLYSNVALLTVGGALAVPVATITQPTCATLGQIVVTSPVGTGITYSLNNGTYSANPTFSNLSSGNYSLVAKNASGCTSTPLTFTIQAAANAPTPPVTTQTQPTCTVPTGTITVTAPDPTATYSIDGTSFGTTTVFSGLIPGTYTVTIKNAAGCTATSPNITINTAPGGPATPTATLVQPTCAVPNASITVTAPIGTGYTYSINGTDFYASPIFSAPQGTYTVIVKNAAGCTASGTPIVINPVPAAPAAPTLTTTHPTCTTTTGSITVSNATTGLEYQLDSGSFQTTATFNGVNPGSHTVTVRNAAGCTATSGSVIINPAPSAPAAPTLVLTQPTCTTTTGSITVSNATTGLEYQLDSGSFQTTAIFNGVNPGSHTVTVRNAAGCTTTSASVTITAASAPPVPTLTATQPTCNVSTGGITVVNAVAGLEYQLDTGSFQNSSTFNSVAPGSHTVTVRNPAGCTATSTSIIINPAPSAPAVPTLSLTHPTCAVPTGSITVTNAATGLEYRLDSGTFQTSATFTLVNPGPHTVTVRNAAGCTTTSGTVTINTPPTPPAVPTLVLIQPTCLVNTGTITVSNAAPGLEYQLDSGSFQSAPTFNFVAVGTHTVTVRNAAGCTATSASVTMTSGAANGPATPLLALVQPTCSVSTGRITIINPEPGVEYRVNNGSYQTGTVFDLLPPGNYTIVARNAGGCTTTSGSVSIFTAPVIPSIPSTSVVQPDCITRTGTITVGSPLGSDLQYRVNNGGYQNSPVFTGLAAGTYTVTVRNSNGCTATSGNIVINAAPTTPAPVVRTVQPTCSSATGSITVTAPTGTGYQYSINNVNYQNSPLFANLPAGSYTVVAMDVNGCTSRVNITIFAAPGTPQAPVATTTQPTCSVGTGSLTVSVPRGTGYRYSINGGTLQTSPMFANLVPGTYTVTVRNQEGCEASSNVTIDAQPGTPLAPTLVTTQPLCGDTTGSITVTAPTGNYTYSINGGMYRSQSSFTQLAPGYYTIIAKSDAGCVSAATTTRILPAPIVPTVPTLISAQPTCATPYGTITVTAPVGPGITYSIDGLNFGTNLSFTNLAGGNYNVTVKNNAGCTAVSQTVIIDTAPAPAPAPGVITGNIPICADSTLQLSNTVTGGVWSISNNSIATIDANGLVTPVHPGSATVYYTVGTTCTAKTEAVITINPLPYIALRDLYLCVDNKTQNVIAPKTLDTGLNNTDYSFVWEKDGQSLPDTTPSIQVSEPGVYTVNVVVIATGCTGSAQATVGTSSMAIVSAEVGEDFNNNQSITVNVTGGSGDYIFSLDNNAFQTSPVFTGVEEGEHTIVVYDNHGCGRTEITVFAINYPRFFTPNNDGANDTWKINGLSKQRDARIYIYDRYGKLVATLLPQSGIGWDGTLNGHPLPATDYWFSVFYTSSNGVQKEFKAHFSLLR